MSSLQIGLLGDTAQKLQYLKNLVQQSGHNIAQCLTSPAWLETDQINQVDAWVVDTGDGDNAALDHLLEMATVQVVLTDSSEFAVGSEEHSAWSRRMATRLQRLSGDINLQATARAPSLWVLAASTGGPAAVKEFLSHLPAELGIAFVYVQHIDANYGATLIKMMSNAGSYPASLAYHGAVLQRDTIALLSAERHIEICSNGTLLLSDQPWGGCYAPSIDQVVANVARTYRERSGLIIFTGMGDDGAISSRLIKQQGGQVWAQSPASCTSSSMPDAALAMNSVSFCGTPRELALQLAAFCRQSITTHYLEGKGSHESTTTHRN